MKSVLFAASFIILVASTGLAQTTNYPKAKVSFDDFKGLVIIGATAIIGSIPFYCIDKPILIVHQSYKYVRSGPDFIDHQTGIFYGVLLDLVGLCCIYLYFRVIRNLPEDDRYRYHRRGEE